MAGIGNRGSFLGQSLSAPCRIGYHSTRVFPVRYFRLLRQILNFRVSFGPLVRFSCYQKNAVDTYVLTPLFSLLVNGMPFYMMIPLYEDGRKAFFILQAVMAMLFCLAGLWMVYSGWCRNRKEYGK